MTGDWTGIKALSRKITGKTSAGESASMSEMRGRIQQFLGLGAKK